ncbi:MAG TPA: hypothetical protein VEJ63_08075, partial [Planctomycetota bacterium]|nr:hypothetical protein [Planctomycetota bacterium]
MAYRFSCVQLLGMLCALSLVSSSAFALGIDIPKPKKEKKKEEKKETKKEESKSEEKASGEQKSTPPKEGATKEELWAEINKDVEPIVDATLKAYNDKDWNAFFANFPADTRNNKDMVKMLSENYTRFHDSWGAFKSRALVKERSEPDYFAFGKLNYDAQFQKQKGRIEINFKKLDGKFTLLALTFQNEDGSFAHPGAGKVVIGEGVQVGQGGVMEVKMVKSTWPKLKDTVKAGDWVVYEYPANKMKTRMEITEVGDHTYTTKSSTEIAGNKTEQSMKMVFTEPDPKTEEVKEEQKGETKEFPDKVKIPNKGEVSATRYEYYLGGKLQSKAWISK